MGKKKTVTVKVKCKLGAVNVGDHTASVRCNIPKTMSAQDVEDAFVGARLKVVLAIVDPDQGTLDGVDEEPCIDSVADVVSVANHPDKYTFSLGFNKDEIEGADFWKMANKDAFLIVERIGNSSDDVKSAAASEDEDAGSEE